jgi:site-specific DNA-cytosine methylase
MVLGEATAYHVPGRRERALVSGFRVRLRSIEARLATVERRVGFGPDVSDLDEAIARAMSEKHIAADAQDYEQAAELRDTERRLRTEKETKQRRWSAVHPDLFALAESVRALRDELAQMRELLREHGIEAPDDNPHRDDHGEDDQAGGAA